MLTWLQYILAPRDPPKILCSRELHILHGLSATKGYIICAVWKPRSHILDLGGFPPIWRRGRGNATAGIWGVEILHDAGSWYPDRRHSARHLPYSKWFKQSLWSSEGVAACSGRRLAFVLAVLDNDRLELSHCASKLRAGSPAVYAAWIGRLIKRGRDSLCV